PRAGDALGSLIALGPPHLWGRWRRRRRRGWTFSRYGQDNIHALVHRRLDRVGCGAHRVLDRVPARRSKLSFLGWQSEPGRTRDDRSALHARDAWELDWSADPPPAAQAVGVVRRSPDRPADRT